MKDIPSSLPRPLPECLSRFSEEPDQATLLTGKRSRCPVQLLGSSTTRYTTPNSLALINEVGSEQYLSLGTSKRLRSMKAAAPQRSRTAAAPLRPSILGPFGIPLLPLWSFCSTVSEPMLLQCLLYAQFP